MIQFGEIFATNRSLNVAYKHSFVALFLRIGIIHTHLKFFTVCPPDQESNQLKKHFGEILEGISSQIEPLSLENLESLGEDFFDFNSLEDYLVS